MNRHPLLPAFYFLISLLMLVYSGSILAEEKSPQKIKEGTFSGAKETEYPAWFKDSFLDIGEDVKEATDANKRLMLFFYQNGCPYCNALVERNFSQKAIKDKSQKNFDIVAVNMWGDRPVIDVNGKDYTEKTFAAALKVQFTPTILFFNEQGKVILRLNGYRSPQKFIIDLDYVAGHKESKVNFLDYVKANLPHTKASKTLNDESFFIKGPYDFSQKSRKGNTRPFAVFFEQKDCPDCDRLHNKVLPDKQLLKIIKQFDVAQLDMWSKTPVITPSGQKMTAREWARKLDIEFAPSIVLFNPEGKEIIRSEAFFKVFHTQGIFNYVLSGGYKKEPSFQRYLTEYANHLREQGIDVNIWRNSDDK
ncbi:MAG: thioredoxin fold domain-containing protein [Gammaproteobacteria bacterium]|nr:thioredoxin fold domain-containing protein [Gammaproteobacteria bacterium]